MSIILVQGRNRIVYVASMVYIVSSRLSIVYRVILSQQQKQQQQKTLKPPTLLKLLVSFYD